jgi:hypothetical protein
LARVYFTDRDLGKQFPARLREAGLQVERHADHFDPATPDEVWLPEVGRRGWVVLTHDERIRYKPNERDAVMRHGVRLLVVQGRAPYPHLAEWFVQTLPRIEAFVGAHAGPYIAKVLRPTPKELAGNPAAPGQVVLWVPARG